MVETLNKLDYIAEGPRQCRRASGGRLMTTERMAVVVTGADGFVGKNLVLRLSELGRFDVLPHHSRYPQRRNGCVRSPRPMPSSIWPA